MFVELDDSRFSTELSFILIVTNEYKALTNSTIPLLLMLKLFTKQKNCFFLKKKIPFGIYTFVCIYVFSCLKKFFVEYISFLKTWKIKYLFHFCQSDVCVYGLCMLWIFFFPFFFCFHFVFSLLLLTYSNLFLVCFVFILLLLFFSYSIHTFQVAKLLKASKTDTNLAATRMYVCGCFFFMRRRAKHILRCAWSFVPLHVYVHMLKNAIQYDFIIIIIAIIAIVIEEYGMSQNKW